MSQPARLPTRDESEWVKRNLASLKEVVRQFTRSGRSPFDPRVLDAAYSAWVSQHQHKLDESTPMINAFAVAFGQHLIDTLKLRWMVLEGEEGEGIQYGIQGDADEILLIPTQMVQERFTAGSINFFDGTYTKIKKDIDKARQTG
jgi:hypothetical protein